MTPARLEGAATFIAELERVGWRFSLTADGDLYVQVGLPMASVQDQVWAVLHRFEREIKHQLGECARISH